MGKKAKKGGKSKKKGSDEAQELTPEQLAALEKKKVIDEMKALKDDLTNEMKLINIFQQSKVRTAE